MRNRFANDEELREDESSIITALLAAGIDIRDRLTKTIDAVVWAERREAEAAALEDRFYQRKKRYESRAAQLRGQVEQLMTDLALTRFHGTQASAALQRGQPKLVVPDENVPSLAEYWKTPPAVFDRVELKDDLRAGVVLDGAYLSNSAPMLVIRRK